MRLEEFKENKEKVLVSLGKIKDSINDKEILKFIDKRIEEISEDKFIISVFGNFSSGKSSFLNVLMGFKEDVLAVDEKVCTATITRIAYPKNKELLNCVNIIYRNGRETIVGIDEIKNYTARNEKFSIEDEIQEIIVYLDSEILKNGVEIVDTPGFNSSYTAHTEIAKKYIENSNAAIFLFDYEKPGSKREFEFLSEVRDKMERIFFVLNKIDLENPTENTLEKTRESLKGKIEKEGVITKNKKIYPISATWAREGLIVGEEERNFKNFREALIEYLLSQENIKDRIESPIKQVIYKLNEERKSQRELMNCLSSNENELNEKIERKEKKLDELQEDLEERQRSINRLLQESIRKTVKGLDKVEKDVIANLDNNLEQYKTKFSFRMCNFKIITSEIARILEKGIQGEMDELIDKIEKVIDENVDDEKYSEIIKGEIIKIAKKNFRFSKKDYSDINKSNASELRSIEERLEEEKEKLEAAKQDYYRALEENERNEVLLADIDESKKMIEKIWDEKRSRLDNIGMGQVITYKESEREEREGIIGNIWDKVAGRKIVSKTVVDNSDIDKCDREKERIEKKYSEKVEEISREISTKKGKVKSSTRFEVEIQENENNYERMSKNYSMAEERAYEELEEEKENIVKMKKGEYRDCMLTEIETIKNANRENLRSNTGIIKLIISKTLSDLEKKIQREKEEINSLNSLNSMSKEDLNLSINEKSNKLIQLDKCIKGIEKMKAEVMGNECQ